jgi:hypothetical protein
MSDLAVLKPWTEELTEARQLAAGLSASLPDKIEIAALGVRSKAPFQLLAVREALIWRTEELARGACDALEKEDFTVAALLIRSIAESAAMTWYLLEILENRKGYTPAELNDKPPVALSDCLAFSLEEGSLPATSRESCSCEMPATTDERFIFSSAFARAWVDMNARRSSNPALSDTLMKSLLLFTKTTDFFFSRRSSITLLSVPVLLQSQIIKP